MFSKVKEMLHFFVDDGKPRHLSRQLISCFTKPSNDKLYSDTRYKVINRHWSDHQKISTNKNNLVLYVVIKLGLRDFFSNKTMEIVILNFIKSKLSYRNICGCSIWWKGLKMFKWIKTQEFIKKRTDLTNIPYFRSNPLPKKIGSVPSDPWRSKNDRE